MHVFICMFFMVSVSVNIIELNSNIIVSEKTGISRVISV